MSTRPVVFFHVMKCGGTSVRTGLAMGIASRRQGPEIFELEGQAAIRAVGGIHRDNWAFRDALLPYVLSAMEPALVVGHFRYRDRYDDGLLGDAHLITVLRDPLERLVSLYRYRRYKEGVDRPVSIPFNELLQTGRWTREGHAYIDTFCGRDDLDPHSDEAVAAAVENLRRFAVVGRTDQLEEFGRRVTECVGKEVTMPVLNTSPAPVVAGPDATGIDEESLALAREVCEPDFRVYDQIAELTSTA